MITKIMCRKTECDNQDVTIKIRKIILRTLPSKNNQSCEMKMKNLTLKYKVKLRL